MRSENIQKAFKQSLSATRSTWYRRPIFWGVIFIRMEATMRFKRTLKRVHKRVPKFEIAILVS